MNSRKIFSIFSIFVCITVMFSGVTFAEETSEMVEVDINLKSAYEGERGGVEYNLAENNIKEHDTWPISIDGRYYGPFIPCGLVNMEPEKVVSFNSSFSIGSDIVSYGASEFWIRIPIVGSNIVSLSLTVNNNVPIRLDNPSPSIPNTNIQGFTEIETRPTGGYGNVIWHDRGVFVRWSRPYVSDRGFLSVKVDNAIPLRGSSVLLIVTQEQYGQEINQRVDIMGGGISFSTNIGVPLGWGFVFTRGLSREGIYSLSVPQNPDLVLRNRGWHEITAEKKMSLKEIFYTYWGYGIVEKVRIHHSMNKTGQLYTITDNFRRTSSGWEIEIYYEYSLGEPYWVWEEYDISGITADPGQKFYVKLSDSGFHNWTFAQDNSPYIPHDYGNYLFKYSRVNDWVSNSHITVSLPFRGVSGFDIILLTTGVTSHTNNTFFARVDPVEDMLIYSFPQEFVLSSDNFYYQIWIIPHNSIEIYGVYNNDVYFHLDSYAHSKYGYTIHSIGDNFGINTRIEQMLYTLFFLTVDAMPGVFTKISSHYGYKFFDFGWGTAYNYPGDITLYVELDHNTTVMFRGRPELMYNPVDVLLWEGGEEGDDKDLSFGGTIVRHIRNSGKSVRGGVTGFVSTVWDNIVGLLEWIYNALVSFITKAYAFLKNVVNFVVWQLYGLILVAGTFGLLMMVNVVVSFVGGEDVSKVIKDEIKSLKSVHRDSKKRADEIVDKSKKRADRIIDKFRRDKK